MCGQRGELLESRVTGKGGIFLPPPMSFQLLEAVKAFKPCLLAGGLGSASVLVGVFI